MYNSKVIPDYCNQRLQSPLDFELFFSNPPQISSPNTYIHVQFKSDTIPEKLLISRIKRANQQSLLDFESFFSNSPNFLPKYLYSCTIQKYTILEKLLISQIKRANQRLQFPLDFESFFFPILPKFSKRSEPFQRGANDGGQGRFVGWKLVERRGAPTDPLTDLDAVRGSP